ncbi:SAM-dependent methyltransferase [Roseospirillum parvum]|uniref:Methyltransferase domain-containing protein n=1 Tax=Roseospirillum parvum TaxID=83401 RepID=A0A1G7WB50_9PROT|nr:class I SAM-dependent methyltransferase [Roseospirillum parvum]SDG69223.1 Methyltransferase domain-containing protein [Roseospirillum parvum]
MTESDPAIAALIALHRGLPRQGPGSTALTARLLDDLAPRLPARPRVADLGCGSGVAARQIAEHLDAEVVAVDFAADFIDQLKAAPPPAAGRVIPRVADMLDPGLGPASLDLIWSEGAAYAVGVPAALAAWRPLLRPGGVLVLSECVWFTPDPPPEAARHWAEAYPGMTTASGLIARAEAAGFGLLSAHRLPAEAWWESYYTPLAANLARLEAEPADDPHLIAAIAETRREMALFKAHHTAYGYLIAVLGA